MNRLSLCLFAAIAVVNAACAQVQAPVTGRTQYMLVSEETVARVSADDYHRQLQRLRAQGRLNVNRDEFDRVSRIKDRLVPAAIDVRPDTRSWRWEINVSETREINAFCMAGGKIMVLSGLIEKMHPSDDELAGVVAHEIGHALAQHVRESVSLQLTENLLLTGIGTALAANRRTASAARPAVNDAAMISSLLWTLPHTRGQEAEADRIGATLMANAGYNPYAMVTLFRKMEQLDPGQKEFLSDHPSSENRARTIEALLQSSGEFQMWTANGLKAAPGQSQFTYVAGFGSDDERKYKAAAEAGDANAQLTLGVMYAAGRGVPKNPQVGAQWITRAAAQGHPVAENQAGVLYSRGIGVPRSDVIAASWYAKAAEHGNAAAKSNLGVLYMNGSGVGKDPARAAALFSAAMAAGVPQAAYNLGVLYAAGAGVRQDDAEAVRLYRRAADEGVVTANVNLSAAYLTGRGVTANDAEGFRLAKIAADQGELAALYIVGVLYHEGRGVGKNDGLAEFYVRLSAERGYPEAQYAAGRAYADGVVVDKDEAEAVRWFQKAAAQGHQKAKDELTRRGL